MLELCQVKVFILRPAVLSLAEFGEQLKLLLALVARLEHGQIFQGLYRKEVVSLRS